MPSYKIAGSKWSWTQVQTSPSLRGTWIHIPTLGLGSASKSSSRNLLGKVRPMNCPLSHWRAARAACCWTHLLCLPCIASKGVKVKPFFNPGMLILAFGLRRTHPSLIWYFNSRIFLLLLPFHRLGQWTETPGRQKPSPRSVVPLGAAQGQGRAGALAGKALPVLLASPSTRSDAAASVSAWPCHHRVTSGERWHLPGQCKALRSSLPIKYEQGTTLALRVINRPQKETAIKEWDMGWMRVACPRDQ